jgi:putative flippase GtrA
MSGRATAAETPDRGRVLRYIVNGMVATVVHFAVLTFGLKILAIGSAGLANLGAAVFGVTASFLGNRYYVFRKWDEPIVVQAAKFATLYVLTVCLHGLVLFGWSDIWRLDYRTGFIVATALQVLLTYWGSKLLVFNR